MECECYADDEGLHRPVKIVQCPLCKSAPKLLAACERANAALDCCLSQDDAVAIQDVLEAAIKAGRGE